MSSLQFACPRCQSVLRRIEPDGFRCPTDGLDFVRLDGVWRFLLPEREEHFASFRRDYELIRQGEGRGSNDQAYYRALPWHDLTAHFSGDWRIRAASFRCFIQNALLQLEHSLRRPLKILDVGAGNGWLAYRLTQRGHILGAIDLNLTSWDGLGAHRYYDTEFCPIQAEFDRLPLQAGQLDLVIYNASLHYSEDYARTLREAQRVLTPGGQIVVLDSPIYSDPRSGQLMVGERETHFSSRFGLASNSLDSENFLTLSRLDALAGALKLRWRRITPFYGWRWWLRPWLARLRGRREPAQFAVLVASAQLDDS